MVLSVIEKPFPRHSKSYKFTQYDPQNKPLTFYINGVTDYFKWFSFTLCHYYDIFQKSSHFQ